MKIRNIINEALTAAEEEELKKLGQVLKNDPTLQKDTAFSGLFSKFDTWMSGKSQPTANATTPLGAATKANAYLKKEQIEKIQGSLRKAGVTAVGNPGVNDELFAKAVFDFQKIAKLPLTGKYDMPTYRALQDAAWGKGSSPTGVAPDAGKTEPTAELTRPGDKGKYKIISSKQWEKDPEVTVLLSSRINADGTTSYTVRGINVKNNTTYDLPAGSRNTSDDLNVMKQIFNSDIELSGPFPITNPNTIQGMFRTALASPKPAPNVADPTATDPKWLATLEAIKKATGKTDKEVRYMIGKFRLENPDATPEQVQAHFAPTVTTPEEFDKLPGKVLKKSGDISEYKILDTKPYTNDPSVTAVLFAQKYDGDVRFFISGLDPVDRREFTPGEEVISNHDKNLAKMKAIFASPLKLKGPYLFYPNTVAMMLANEIRQAAAPVNPKTTNITPLGPNNNPENKTLPPFPVSPNTKPSPSLGNETPFGDRQGR